MNKQIRRAIQRRDLPKLIGLLDEAGDDINLDTHDDQGDTALHLASWRESPEIIELLLSRGATPDVVCGEWFGDIQAPLHIVSENVCGRDGQNNLEIAQILIRYGASVDVLDAVGRRWSHATGKSC